MEYKWVREVLNKDHGFPPSIRITQTCILSTEIERYLFYRPSGPFKDYARSIDWLVETSTRSTEGVRRHVYELES